MSWFYYHSLLQIGFFAGAFCFGYASCLAVGLLTDACVAFFAARLSRKVRS